MSAQTYRPEIDGLRAIAVTPVVLYHGFPTALPGGFAGVDVFFVISGFLICSIIAQETQAGRFSLLGFYERRARRILPALVVMMAATFAAGWFVMIPRSFEALGESMVATAWFASNIYFFLMNSDYFAEGSENAPLLHTWSLGVEEQFYIVAPVLLYLAIRHTGLRGALAIMTGLAVASLALAVAVGEARPGFAFYLPLTRVYELGIGAILALAPRPALRRAVREGLGLAGLAMIAAALALFDADTVFPGYAALLPCLGTALVILAADRTTLAGRALSLRPMVHVGLLSYSWYLWHWPVLVLAKHVYGGLDRPVSVTVLCLLLSYGLAALSLRYVETPFRQRRVAATRSAVFAWSGAALAAVAVVGLGTWQRDGLPARMPDRLQPVVVAMEGELDLSGGLECRVQGLATICRNHIAEQNTPVQIVLLGDSHARGMGPDLLRDLDSRGMAGEVIFRGACPPLPDVVVHARDRAPDVRCSLFMAQALERIDGMPELSSVMLHSRWALYGSGHRFRDENGGPVYLTASANAFGEDTAENLPLLEDRLTRLLDDFTARGLDVALIGSVPEIGWNVSWLLAGHIRTGASLPNAPVATDFDPDARGAVDARLKAIAQARTGVTYLPVVDAFCRPDCVFWDGRVPIYTDSHHVSPFGTHRLVGKIAPYLTEVAGAERP